MEHFDLAFISLYVFWLFFAGLLFYLRREDRREGYPLELDTAGTYKDHGLMWIPKAKTFNLHGGVVKLAPSGMADNRPVVGQPIETWPGAPIEPTGPNPMLDGIGPSSYAMRADVPDMSMHNQPKIMPLRVLKDFAVHERDPNIIGYPVIGSDWEVAGRVVDLWVDRGEALIRYLEVEVPLASKEPDTAVSELSAGADELLSSDAPGDTKTTRRVLFPMPLATINRRARRVEVTCVLGEQFQHAPATRSSDRVTMLEEEKISAYFASGYLYSRPHKREPLL
ncbi:MAG: PRC-barrel domain-containing protein [Alphaproteobacteria bacterium]|nr:PRC-barrel domain-containing protein [Alphaproteobacteria bacterium]